MWTTGKFVAPHGGTYRFTTIVMNVDGNDRAYVRLKVNGVYGRKSCLVLAAGEGDKLQTGMCNRVVRMKAGDEAWVMKPDWDNNNNNLYRNDFTVFEGFMIRGDT